ncbi:MAG TPA: M15 family metallopeptidase [Thermoanaerobaculia bacterium]|jgi:D-alanyl-D-alanine dipeptidase
MRRFASLLFVLALACATTVDVPLNRHGLAVVPDAATYVRLARTDPDKQLVDLSTLNIPLDVRYATENNFMKKVLYPAAKSYLRAPAARALAAVQRELAPRGIGIKVFDAYRPYRVTEAMWEPIRNPDYVADPAKGSRHNRGAAVDLTLIDLRTGTELPMPTPYDDFTSRAHHDFNDLPADALANRALLREVMTKHGFDPLPSEWWHYDFRGWERFELMDVGLEEL